MYKEKTQLFPEIKVVNLQEKKLHSNKPFARINNYFTAVDLLCYYLHFCVNPATESAAPSLLSAPVRAAGLMQSDGGSV